jgi:mono/diheme cytochrome c family protein
MKKFLIFLASTLLLGVACSNKEQYIRPVDDKPYEATPEKVARGAYLVNNVAVCHLCHTTRKGKQIIEPYDPSNYLAGYTIDIPGMIKVTAPNLTSDMDGLGGWSDDQIARALRDGVSHDGRLLEPFMPFYDYKRFSDADTEAIVVYLRSLEKRKNGTEKVETEIAFPMNMILGMMNFHSAPAKDVKPIDKSDKVKYGEFLAHVGHCGACHSGKPGVTTGDKEWLSGNPAGEEIPGVGFVAGRNLTSHKDHGLGKYTKEDFIKAMRTGKRLDGKNMAPPMSIIVPFYGAMTDEDLDALATYIFSLEPADVEIPERKLTPEAEKKVAAGWYEKVPESPATPKEEAPVEEAEEAEAVPEGEAGEAKEGEAKEGEAKEGEAKEGEAKEGEAKTTEAKDGEKKEAAPAEGGDKPKEG